jgi:hypothetical protein
MVGGGAVEAASGIDDCRAHGGPERGPHRGGTGGEQRRDSVPAPPNLHMAGSRKPSSPIKTRGVTR